MLGRNPKPKINHHQYSDRYLKFTMGWSCGELFEYSAWYWGDKNVASCRVEEAQRVCKEVFHLGSGQNAITDSHDTSQSNSGVNLLTLNMFGQTHSISHVGFFTVLAVIILIAIAAWLIRRHFSSVQDALRGPKTRRKIPEQMFQLQGNREMPQSLLTVYNFNS